MRRILFWFLALSSLTMLAFGANDVTFQVNMRVQSKIQKFDPTKDSVYIRGSFNGWSGKAQKLTDADNDSVYTGTFDVGVAPKNITYKFVVIGPSYGGDHWEFGTDRKDTIPATPMTLPVAWFDRDSTSTYFANDVTFQVNMKYRMILGKFNKATDSVVVRGEFNGWGGKKHVLADADNDSIYTGTYSIPSWTFLKYKFVKIGTGEDWESSPDRLVENLTGPTTNLPVVWFNNADPAHGMITFQVNMRVQSKIKKFDPTKDSVYIRGSFNGWGGKAYKVTDPNNDSIYTGVFDLGSVPKKITYKFVVIGPSYGGDHWEYGNDRTDSIPSTPFTIPIAVFDRDDTAKYFANDVTFQVNMKEQMKLGKFTIATDSVIVRGEFNGWGGKQHLLNDANNDSIYTGTFSLPSWTWLKYKFVRVRPGGEDWESSPDRIVENLTGPTTTLPVVFFNNYDPKHAQVTFQVNMKVQSRIKKFDPTKDSVYVRGSFTGWGGKAYKVTDPNNDSIYTGTFDVGPIQSRVTYKFVVIGPTYGGDHWEFGADRSDSIPSTPFTLPVAVFDRDDTAKYFANAVTFRVNMKARIKKALFTKGTDSVVVRGEFNGWGGKQHVLADADNDSIYTGTFNLPSWTWLKYKFVRIKPGGEDWESSSDIIVENLTGPTTMLPIVFFNNDSVLTSVKLDGAIALTYELNQNYPNPFNPSTTIKYSIPNNDFVTLKVFNILGQEVATLVNAQHEAGKYEVTLDGTSLTSGVYIYRVEAGSFVSVKKMMLLK